MNEIRKRHIKLEAKLQKVYDALDELKQICPHEHTEGEYKGDSGNWCPHDDSYWIDARCLDCGKRWHIDSKTPEYRTFIGAKLK